MYRILNSFNRLETLRSDVIGCALPRGSGANNNVYSETQPRGRFLSSTQSPILAVPPRPLSSQEGGQARPAQDKFERAVRDNAQHSSEAPGSRKSNLANVDLKKQIVILQSLKPSAHAKVLRGVESNAASVRGATDRSESRM
ncbi:hypothetical protein L915_15778 [Phytophthora nicotianae]|uniref:Uncharacterized protein n=1 Tax=Phytophthora nicotianae TaxID=4792 RepID=W2G782_PHYNI|nr:hypothetical protein L915_15778 [Phytophthora nicotianae]ETL31569.1 hypothetical protein L916_15670 [Phytophthora nicotianae]